MRVKLLAPAALAALVATAVAPTARADTSAWMFFGVGGLGWKPGAGNVTIPNKLDANGTMTIEAGAGSSPDARVIVGGLFRIQPIFGNGTDIAALLRVCSHGFQAGDFGLAVDAGAYARFWGIQGGGFTGAVNLGLPLGFTLTLQTEVGSSHAMAFGALAGLDLLRLTVYRQTLLKWWNNPSPGWKVPPRTAGLSF